MRLTHSQTHTHTHQNTETKIMFVRFLFHCAKIKNRKKRFSNVNIMMDPCNRKKNYKYEKKNQKEKEKIK